MLPAHGLNTYGLLQPLFIKIASCMPAGLNAHDRIGVLMSAHIGVTGLAVMGANLARNLARNGFTV
ncbi:NAD(P)-binding domain-containing protein, partial [Paenarthrobacter sp. NPDC058040]|uniref:NAD(P)-binding domain-containing protein n=1 Tax=unclassified Paenarthrobacter TaxID=2634190 RepID=UPI0036D8DAFD